MSMMDSVVSRGFLFALGASEFTTPVVLVLCLALLPPLVAAGAAAVLVLLSVALGQSEEGACDA